MGCSNSIAQIFSQNVTHINHSQLAFLPSAIASLQAYVSVFLVLREKKKKLSVSFALGT